MADHPAGEGLVRVRVRFPRDPSLPGELIAVYGDGTEHMVGDVTRTENKPGSSRGYQANLWADHPSLAEGRPLRAAKARDLGRLLTESVKAEGPWWS